MRRLTLVRHAKSDWSLPGQQDWDRPLNKRGQRDAPEMARRLRSRRLRPDLVLTSPAVRAVTTATVMARELKLDVARIAQDERLKPRGLQEMMARSCRELGGDAVHVMMFGPIRASLEFANRLSSGDRSTTCRPVACSRPRSTSRRGMRSRLRRRRQVRLPGKLDLTAVDAAGVSAPAATEHRDCRTGHRVRRIGNEKADHFGDLLEAAPSATSASGMGARFRGGVDRPGQYSVDRDTTVAQLGREAFGQALHAGL
jgi:phosphohistidine phosphatase